MPLLALLATLALATIPAPVNALGGDDVVNASGLHGAILR
jgi:hypothetical protein